MPSDFTLHFDLPDGGARQDLSQAEMEHAFAIEQIQILLDFVTLYQDGKALNPDAFSIVNRPGQLHDLAVASEAQHE